MHANHLSLDHIQQQAVCNNVPKLFPIPEWEWGWLANRKNLHDLVLKKPNHLVLLAFLWLFSAHCSDKKEVFTDCQEFLPPGEQ